MSKTRQTPMKTSKEKAIKALYNLLREFDDIADFVNRWNSLSEKEIQELNSIYTKLDLFIEKIENH
jgi:phytoene/squalene synthetase